MLMGEDTQEEEENLDELAKQIGMFRPRLEQRNCELNRRRLRRSILMKPNNNSDNYNDHGVDHRVQVNYRTGKKTATLTTEM